MMFVLFIYVVVFFLHADKLEFQIRNFIHQFQFLRLQRGSAEELLEQTHTC